MAEHAHGIGVSSQHHVAEADVVVGVQVSRHDPGEHGLLVHLNVVQGFEGETEVSQQAVDSQETNDGEVPEHSIQGSGSILSGHCLCIFASLCCRELLVDLRALDERVKHV